MDLDVINANPRQLAMITRSQKKNDKKDALLLAQIGAGAPQILGHVQHRSPRAHADLAVIKTRAKLVRARSEYVTTIRGLVKTVGVQIDPCDATYFFRKAPSQIPAELSVACDPLIVLLTLLHEQILELDKTLEKIAERYPAVDYLTQIDRVGTLTALLYVLTIEDPKRFLKNRTVGSYVGLAPRMQDSGDRTTQLGITKAGDKELRGRTQALGLDARTVAQR
ncbi:MAG: IS110 family transposase [Planctomycetes bacterium]|nr:IS110 family transposase [Planctomycetota bacterium]